jgi:hypothetical protein
MEEGGQGERDTTIGWEENRAGEKRGREGEWEERGADPTQRDARAHLKACIDTPQTAAVAAVAVVRDR